MKRYFLTAAALLGFTILLFIQYIIINPLPMSDSDLGTDLPREIWTQGRFIQDTFRAEQKLPFWRPYLLSGSALLGNPVNMLFYPPHWLLLILPLPLAINLNFALHLWWMALGMYTFLRIQFQVRHIPALIGAVLFGLSPKWMAHISGGHLLIIIAVAWSVWALVFFTLYWRDKQWIWAVLLGVALAAQIFSHGMFLILCLVALGIWTLIKLTPSNSPASGGGFKPSPRQRGELERGQPELLVNNPLWSAIQLWGIALPIALGLAAIHLLPLLELLPYTGRSTLSRSDIGFGSLPPPLILAMFFPANLKFPEWYLYPGMIALLLVYRGWACGWTSTERRLGWLFVAGLILSLGSYTPIYRLLELVPGASLLRVPPRWWIFSLFALAILAVMGLEKWQAGTALLPRRIKIGRGLAGLLVLFALSDLAGMLPFSIFPGLLVLVMGLVVLHTRQWRWLLILLLIEVGWNAGYLLRPIAEGELLERDSITTYLADHADEGRVFAPYQGINEMIALDAGLQTVDGYDPYYLTGYHDLVMAAMGCDYSGYSVRIPAGLDSTGAEACPNFQPNLALLDLLQVRYVVLPLEKIPADWGDAVIADDKLAVFALETTLPAVFGVAAGIRAENCRDQLTTLDPRQAALVEENLPWDTITVPPQVLEQSGDSYQVSGGGLLIRSASWSPGWSVEIDGRRESVLRVNCGLQGVWLDKGDHTVRFVYLPSGYRIGRWISLLASIVVASVISFRLWWKI